jgi:hypothetical protein
MVPKSRLLVAVLALFTAVSFVAPAEAADLL